LPETKGKNMNKVKQLLALSFIVLSSSNASSPSSDLRLWPDNDHAPFLHGVASADPLPDSVLIWTRVSDTSTGTIKWAIWERDDPTQSFEAPFQFGNNRVTEIDDYTLTVDVSGLKPGISYRYQFEGEDGRKSMVGATKTASIDATLVSSAFLSCTSLWSGFFNMYRHLANDDSIDFVLHVGDFLYPEIDKDEMYRVPTGLCTDWKWFRPAHGHHGSNKEDPFVREMVDSLNCSVADPLTDFRWMYSFYMLDPDLRAARAAHPFIVALDNHDDNSTFSSNPFDGARKAALEWIPQRVHLETNPNANGNGLPFVNTLRSFRFGHNLLDLVVLDTNSYAGNETMKIENGLLGDGQHEWLEGVLGNSSGTQWRMIGSGKTFMPFAINNLCSALTIPFGIVAGVIMVLLSTCIGAEVCLLKRGHYERIHTPQKDILLVIDEEEEEVGGRDIIHESMETIKNAHNHSPLSLGRCTCVGLIALVALCIVWVGLALFLRNKLSSTGLMTINDHSFSWEGQPECMRRLLDQLEATGTDSNNIWATGDMHYSYAADVFKYDPFGKDLLKYRPSASSLKRYGVEMIAGSGTRGNLDEKAGEFSSLLKPQTYFSKYIVSPIANRVIMAMNPHYRYFDGQAHGYGKIQVSHDYVEARFYQFPILQVTDEFRIGETLFVESGVNKWQKNRSD
jgi:phosphodiesterase/alkaline phosphatase D-like protein